MKLRVLTSISAVALVVASNPVIAKPRGPELPDRIALGRDSNAEPCTAVRNWSDPLLTGSFSKSFSITCRGPTATRSIGVIWVVPVEQAEGIESSLACGAVTRTKMDGIGAVDARRCTDKSIGLQTQVTRFDRKKRRFVGSGISSIQGPIEEGLKILSGTKSAYQDRIRNTTASVSFADVAAAPDNAAGTLAQADTSLALAQGISLNHQGLHFEASRVLNDALSRLDVDAPAATRVELLLEAGLADSNIRFFDAATDHFQQADAAMDAAAISDRGALLARKRKTYAALDLLNRRSFAGAISSLDQLVSAPTDPSQPLTDMTTLRTINQNTAKGNDVSSAIAVPDIASLSQLVIDSQANWARSVALLSQGDAVGATAALDQAERSFNVLRKEKVDQLPILWLDARIERQRGRLAARRGDWRAAVASFDRAIASLERGSGSGGVGPALAETRMERAGIESKIEPNRKVILKEFSSAIGDLVSTGATGGVLPPAVEQYLDLLVEDSTENPSGTAIEDYFQAIQAVGEPAVARQLSQLQTLVAADQSVGAKVRDRNELEREITRLRYEISRVQTTDAGAARELEVQRAAAEKSLIAIDSDLQGSSRFSSVNDRPATVATVRAALRPGEIFLKVTEVRRRAFGIVIDAAGAQIYPIDAPIEIIEDLAKQVRSSIDGTPGKLVPFNVSASYTLFKLMSGTATDRLLAAKAVVVDPSGPLSSLPAGVLVTDRASVEAYNVSRSTDPFDFSQVSFLAKRMAVSSALSPRSFIVARTLPESTAPQPFIGFGTHVPAPMAGRAGNAMVSVGFGCNVEYKAISALSNALVPVSSREITLAEQALGLANAPQMTGAAFTDTAMRERTDLDQFQVLHFATHGLQEGQWGCAKSPPALVTTMDGGDSDGLLSFSEVAGLRLNANLVVLSACDTARGVSQGQARGAGQEEAANTLEGLVRAFLTANARAVLATYWQVSAEEETDQLIQTFYSSGRVSNIGSALKTAQTVLIDQPQFSHPFYWGAYFVVGDSSKTMLSGPAVAVAPKAVLPDVIKAVQN
jgi:tetratricopeptide (TPR) repeat protein